MYSRKSIIRITTAALVIGAGLAASGGTALADPSYRSPDAWHRHARQHQSFYQHGRYHYDHYDRGRFGQVRYHQRWHPRDWNQLGWHQHEWSNRRDGNVAYHAPAERAYFPPSALSFTINLPLVGGQYGH